MISRHRRSARRTVVKITPLRHSRRAQSVPNQMLSQALAVARLDQEGDDCANHEDGLEAFAQNDEQRLQERAPPAAGGTH